MPKVLPGYIELRRRQIVEAANACFARSGFHQTTMQDICRESGLSPGAVYRYFRSKEEIIEAMGDEHLQRDLALIEAAKGREDTLRVFDELARLFFTDIDAYTECSIDLYAEAPRNENIRRALQRGSDAIKAAFTDIIQRAQIRGEVNPSLDPEAVARIMMALFQGFVLQKVVDPTIDASAYVRVATAMINGTFWFGAIPVPREDNRLVAH